MRKGKNWSRMGLVLALGITAMFAAASSWAESGTGELVTVSEDSAILSSLSNILPDKADGGVPLHSKSWQERATQPTTQPAAQPTTQPAAQSAAPQKDASCPIKSDSRMGFVPGNCRKAAAPEAH